MTSRGRSACSKASAPSRTLASCPAEPKPVRLLAVKQYSAPPSGSLLPAADKKLFKCNNSAFNFTAKFFADLCGPFCPEFFAKMNHVKDITGAADSTLAMADGIVAAGFVRADATYTLMDDLSVSPMSSSQITLLKQSNVRDVNALEVRVVVLGQDEALQVLIASLQSKSVLSDVFLAGKKSPK